MHFQAAQPRLGYRQTVSYIPAVAIAVVQTLNRSCVQPPRSVLARSSKATSLGWDDLANALPRANPEKRVLQDINFFHWVRECPSWEALQRMEADLRDRYDRQPSLAMAVLLRTSEVVDVEAVTESERRAVAKMLNSSIVPFMINKGIYSYKAHALPSLLAALAALQYNNSRLNAVLLKLLESSVDALLLSQLCSALCSAASLDLRMSPDLLTKVIARLDYTLKFCTAEDVGNLATALAPYSKLPPSADFPFLSRLAARSQPFLEELSGEQLVDLLVLFVRQDFPLTSTWVTSFQTALLGSLPGLTRPRSYASLLFSLAKGSLAISEGFLSALLNRLAASALPGAAAAKPRLRNNPAATAVAAAAAGSGSISLLSRMRPGDLAVVAAVLSIYGYTPQKEWCERYVEALERRAGDMDAKQVVTIVDTCVELGTTLPSDLLDELLAVAEGGLAELPPGRLVHLVSALEAAGHQPDGLWMKRLTAALVAVASRSNPVELADVVAVLPYAPYAYPHDGEATAAVLAAVQARAAELKVLDAATRGSILQSLKDMQHPGAAAFADSLAPAAVLEPVMDPGVAPAPPKRPLVATAGTPPPSVAPALPRTTPPTATHTGRTTAAASAALPDSPSTSVPRTHAPPAAAATAAALAFSVAPPPPAAVTAQGARRQQQQQLQQQLVGSTRTFGRRRSFDTIDEEEGEDVTEEEEEGEEEEDGDDVRRRTAVSRAAFVPPLPPPSPAAYMDRASSGSDGSNSDGGFVASTRRTSRRR